MMKRTVAIGFIGATLDRLGKGAARWQKWRPSIGLCQQPDLLIDRLELIHGNDARDLGLAPNTVRHHIRTIYSKLGVNDKASIAHLLHQFPPG
ncbi:hypothetical protein ALP65_01284 [Pseudomonas aeruginosa]|uniref:Regulator of RNA terminal phosphate cyclase domain-containing protein n=1 Tax=Pseudomonas aeruginosa TaxID=287 RepID=A0A3M5DYE5_PSEAI|nr:hypothetical protein ALP65_01284 [Pseudomonas aeruginosa]